MKFRFTFKKFIALVVMLLLAFVIRYCWVSFPVISGYGAKVLCSAIFVAGINEEVARKQEVGFYPLRYATYHVDREDSSVTCSVLGLAKRKAIFRKGLGSTLLVERPEEEVRAQPFLLAIPPKLNSDSIPWPAGDKLPTGFPVGIDSTVLSKAVEKIFIETDNKKPVRTRAVVVLYDGQLVAEKYAQGFSKDSRLTGWSMTKTITGALTGLLVQQGKLQVDHPAPVEKWKAANDPRQAITIKDLLQQSTGLDFVEDYSKYSDATRMLFMRADMGGYTAARRLKNKPGTEFSYTSGNSNLLSRIIRSTVGDKNYHAFPYEQLFYKLGMRSVVLEPDASGTFVGSSYSYATARDWARFGLMYINKGKFNGQQILSEEWVKASVTPAAAANIGQYGYQLWLNRGSRSDPSTRSFPRLPEDLFYADGFEGQNMFVIPSKKLVVVRLGLTQQGAYDAEGFLSEIISAVR